MTNSRHSFEVLESRIAPAALLPTDSKFFVKATLGGPNHVAAGQVLTTGSADSGSYLLFVEKGDAFVFFTDLNNNKQVDFNELTGISASDGLRLVSFVDVHGDIATNLAKSTVVFPGGVTRDVFTLSDSNSDPTDDVLATGTGGDGRVLLNNTIEKIELRTISITDVGDLNHDGLIDIKDVTLHQPVTTTSIFGNIYAGRGFGTADGLGGLIIDASGATNFGQEVHPSIGSIVTGTAATGAFFSFGASRDDNTSGEFVRFSPLRGQSGGDINGVHVNNSLTLNLDGLRAGDGGIGARGGNISNVSIPFDDAGGYQVVAGNGGAGASGGAGGSILNFSDAGSITSQIVIHSGTGGEGVTGTGGNGGNFTFTNFSVRGDVFLQLGDGGNGFVGGGNGASLTSGNFTQPNDSIGLRAGQAVGTTHIRSSVDPNPLDAGDIVHFTSTVIGTHAGIDFGGIDEDGNFTGPDGFGDFVYTTEDTSQLVVAFGADPNVGGFSGILNLSGVRNPGALVVADFDADGHPDIAVASQDSGSEAGVAVFLSKYNGNTFAGFKDARFSVLPQLTSGDSDADDVFLSKFGFAASPHQISALSAGDFDGDGHVDLAVVVTQYGKSTTDQNGVVTSLGSPTQVLLFMKQDYEVDNLSTVRLTDGTNPGHATGQFYADFGTKATVDQNNSPVPANPLLPFTVVKTAKGSGLAGSIVIEASPLKAGAAGDKFDTLFVGNINDTVVAVYQNKTPAAGGPNNLGNFDLGLIDTDRQTGDTHIDRSPASLAGFSVSDLDGDGFADLAVFTPDNFVIALPGDADHDQSIRLKPQGGNPAVDGRNPVSGQDNAGIFYGPANGGAGFGLIQSGSLVAIKTADLDGNGIFDTLVTLDDNNAKGTRVFAVEFDDFTVQTATSPDKPDAKDALIDNKKPDDVAGSPEVAFDLHLVAISDSTSAEPGAAVLDGRDFLVFGSGANIPLSSTGFHLSAGDGGQSQLGKGGNGGVIGATTPIANSKTVAATVTGSINFTYAGDLVLEAGTGGNGFSTGGNGGSVVGVVTRYRGGTDIGLGVIINAGDGGRGVTGLGGSGGSIGNNSLETSLRQTGTTSTVTAQTAQQVFLNDPDHSGVGHQANGGDGLIGGAGGNIVGNTLGVFDSSSLDVTAFAGNGGNGARGAGSGGTIINFHSTIQVPNNVVGITRGTGSLDFEAGDGGQAVTAAGGAGGSIIASSPNANAYLDDFVYLSGGDGGNGVIGGVGGSVVNFVTQVANGVAPAQTTVLAGQGGNGGSSNGGNGGAVSNVNIPSSGTFGFNSVLSGDGGSSSGGIAGNGGNIDLIRVQSTQGAIAIASGAGGVGLLRGGTGGSVTNAVVETGASATAKVLVIAGAGGDGLAFLPNVNDFSATQYARAFGGAVGQGGNGGSIIGLTQPGNTGAHFDLIAGNGGSTRNFGTLFDTRNFVGSGGSVANIAISGDFGNVLADNPNVVGNQNVPIKSYNDTRSGETIADYVQEHFRDNPDGFSLDDSAGNVGIIVGVAGRNKAVVINPVNRPDVLVPQAANSAPNFPVLNGSLINIQGTNLLAAVAGSVDAIATIRVVSQLQITGISGADKGVVGGSPDAIGAVGAPDFIDQFGRHQTTPSINGRLVDGTVFRA